MAARGSFAQLTDRAFQRATEAVVATGDAWKASAWRRRLSSVSTFLKTAPTVYDPNLKKYVPCHEASEEVLRRSRRCRDFMYRYRQVLGATGQDLLRMGLPRQAEVFASLAGQAENYLRSPSKRPGEETPVLPMGDLAIPVLLLLLAGSLNKKRRR